MKRRTTAVLLPVIALVLAAAVDAAHYLDQFIDRKADPRNDFWEYSVGKWLKENPIPPSERSWASTMSSRTRRTSGSSD